MKLFKLTVKDGKPTMDHKTIFFDVIKKLKDGEYSVQIKRKSKLRSNQTNRYLWAVYTIFANNFGWEPEEVHDYMRSRYFFEMRAINGKEVKILKSTARSTQEELAPYIESVLREGAEHGVLLPKPDEFYLISM